MDNGDPSNLGLHCLFFTTGDLINHHKRDRPHKIHNKDRPHIINIIKSAIIY